MSETNDVDIVRSGGNNDDANNSDNSSDCSSGSDTEVGSIQAIKNNYRHPPLAITNKGILSDSSSSSSSSDDDKSDDEKDGDPEAPPRESNRMEAKLGLIFPVARIKGQLRDITGRSRISNGSGVVLAAAMETLAEFILEQSELVLPIGPKTQERIRSKMLPKDLQMSRHDNETMTDILAGIVIAHGGVAPNIPASLLGPKRKRKRKKRFKIVAAAAAAVVKPRVRKPRKRTKVK